jgi:hypothetical protein
VIRTYATLVGVALLLLVAIGWIGPSNALWGVDALAFYPAWVRAVFAVLGLGGLALLLLAPRQPAGANAGVRDTTAGDDPGAGAPSGRATLRFLAGALVLGAAAFVFRDRTALLGRGYDILVDLGRGDAPSPVSPLFNRLAPALVNLQREAGFPTVTEAGLLSLLVGIVVIGAGAFLLRREALEGPERAAEAALIGALFATQGAIALFFGVVEASPLFAGAVLLFLLFARSAVSGRGGLPAAAILAALAVAAHPFGWALAPALVTAAALGPAPGRRRRTSVVAVGLIVVATGLALAGANPSAEGGARALWHGVAPQRLGEVGGALAGALFDTGDAAPLRSVLSMAHAVDVANHLALTALPALLLLLALAFDAAGRRALVRPASLVALAALLPFLALRIGMRTPLGPMRDWDQFAGVGLALTAWAAFAAAPLAGASGPRRRAIVGLAVLSGVLTLAAWTGISANTERSVARHLARVEGQPALEAPVAAAFHLAMGQRFLSISRTDLAGSAFERAWTSWPSPATAWRAGLAFLAAGRVEKAAAAMTEYTRARPDDWNGWTELGNAWCGMARFDRADEALHRALALNPEAVAPRIHLARSLAMQGKSDAARAQLEVARPRLDPLDPLRADFQLLDAQLPPAFSPRTP